MTSRLQQRIIRLIRQSGSMPLNQYIHQCMADPEDGYYSTNKSIGRTGDFITAPEVSQMFGELLGVWVVETWKNMGCPAPFSLVELGPGNGTMMADILRTVQISRDFVMAANVILVETSPLLVKAQKKMLGPDSNPVWLESIENLPDYPAIILANELLDALPISQYVKQDASWHERVVADNGTGELVWALSPDRIDQRLLPAGADTEPDGSVYEISPARELMVSDICELVRSRSGAALLIDYGHNEHAFGETLQAVRGHQYCDALAAPGMADISSHVDFAALRKLAESFGLYCPKPVTQGEFLLKLGLLERAGKLGAGLDDQGRLRITREAERLALPGQMGDLFKVMAFTNAKNLWPFEEIGTSGTEGS